MFFFSDIIFLKGVIMDPAVGVLLIIVVVNIAAHFVG